MLDSHFITTLQLMVSLANKQNETLNSDILAKELGTNPAFVRKIMAKLSKADLIVTKRGKMGGVTLTRNSKQINLKDIYLAVHEKIDLSLFQNSSSTCSMNCSMQDILFKISKQLEKAHLLLLSQIKLSSLIKEVKNE